MSLALITAGAAAAAQEEHGKKADDHGKTDDAKKADDAHRKAEGGKAEGHGEHGKAEGHGEHHHRLEVSYTERPLTLPRMILAPEGEIAVERLDEGGTALTSLGLGLSARFGITDDLEVSALIAPLDIGPFPKVANEGQFHYGNPKLAATYRFLRDRFELGATLGLTIIHQVNEGSLASPAPLVGSGAILEPGAVFRFHITKEALLEGGLYLPIEFGSVADGLPGNSSGVGLRIPLAFAYDIMEPLHVGVRSGIGVASFSAPETGGSVGENLYIPLGIFAGYAIAGKDGPLLDIDPFFTWNYLLTPGSQTHGLAEAETVHAGSFSAGVSLGGFLYF